MFSETGDFTALCFNTGFRNASSALAVQLLGDNTLPSPEQTFLAVSRPGQECLTGPTVQDESVFLTQFTVSHTYCTAAALFTLQGTISSLKSQSCDV